MLGYTVEELSGLGVRGITHPDDLAADVERGRQMRDGEIDSYRREKRYLRKDGSIFWAELTVSLVTGADDEPTHVVSHVQDITAQKEANLLFEATFERSVVPKVIADDDRRIVDLNESGAELLGVSHDEALELTVDELLPDEPVADIWAAFMEVGALEAEVTLRRPDGTARRIDFTATANVRPGRHIAVVRDLTRQKELEVQLRQAQKMEAVGRLAGGIAHDFNNLLTAIAGYSEFLIGGHEPIPADAPRRGDQEGGGARGGADRPAARLQPAAGAATARARPELRRLRHGHDAAPADRRGRRAPDDARPGAGSDPRRPDQLEQVIVNLAVNARDAMPGGGSVTIETANIVIDDDALVELRMTDTGIGMTDASASNSSIRSSRRRPAGRASASQRCTASWSRAAGRSR